MPINPLIPLQAQAPQIPDQLNALARAMQIKGLQQEQQLGQMKVDEYRRGVEETNRLAGLLQSGADATGLRRAGFHKQALEWEEKQSKMEREKADTEATRIKTATEKLNAWGSGMGHVRQNPTLENAVGMLQHLEQIGSLPPEIARAGIAQVQANPTPEFIAQFADRGFRAALSVKDQLANIQTRNTGGTTDTIAVDPVSQQARVVNSVKNTQSPDAILSAQTSEANNRRSVGASYANAAATREIANATRDAASLKDKRDTEMKLADDYRAQSKNFKDVVDASNRVKSALPSATKSAASTLAAATSFMKMLDPGSVVRESELGMALAATGAIDRLTNYHNTLAHGKVLTPDQAKDFGNITEKVLQAAKQGQKAVDENYKRQAQQYGLRPEMIIQDIGQNTTQPVDLGSLPSAGGGKPRELQWGK